MLWGVMERCPEQAPSEEVRVLPMESAVSQDLAYRKYAFDGYLIH